MKIHALRRLHVAFFTYLLLGSFVSLFGQQPYPASASSAAAATDSLPIVPGDVLSLHVYDDGDLDESHLRVTDAGMVPVLLLGSVRVSGLTPGEAADVIAKAYMNANILVNAHVVVTMESTVASVVTVLGYVNGLIGSPSTTTGVTLPLNAPRPLLSVLAMAGGLKEQASRMVTIKRRDPSLSNITVSIPNDPAVSLANDVLIYPGDIVMVPRAGIVYVLGNVAHASGVLMNEDGKLTLLEALSDAGSPAPTAGLRKVMLFRKQRGTYSSVPINVGRMIAGKQPDIQLQPEDAIWVPFSYGKNLLINGASIAAAIGTSTATGIIYTR